MRWKFKGVRTPPGTNHRPVFLRTVRSHSRAGRLRCDSSTLSQGKVKEDEDVESLESGENVHGHHDALASSVEEFGIIGSTPSVHTQRFGSGASYQARPRRVWKHIGDVERSHPSIRLGDIYTDDLNPRLFLVQPSILQL